MLINTIKQIPRDAKKKKNILETDFRIWKESAGKEKGILVR